MPLWRILAYCPEKNVCPIRDWYAAQSDEVQAAFDATMGVLLATSDWTDDKHEFKVLHRKHEGLGEVRFKVEVPVLRRFRPVGIWPPIVNREFILLVGCEKPIRGVYLPGNAFDLALDFKRMLESGIGEVNEYF